MPSSHITPAEQRRFEAAKLEPVKQKPFFAFGHVSESDRIFFIDNLATLLSAGMPLSLALGTLANEAKDKTMRRALASIKHDVESGNPLSESLTVHPEIFAPLFIAVVEVGETRDEAVQRELREEAGLVVTGNPPTFSRTVFVRYPGYDFIYHIYLLHLDREYQVKIARGEHKDFKWVSPAEALNMELIPDLDICIKLCYPK